MNAKLIFILLVATMLIIDTESSYYRPHRRPRYYKPRYHHGYRRVYRGDGALLVDELHNMLDEVLSSFLDKQEDISEMLPEAENDVNEE